MPNIFWDKVVPIGFVLLMILVMFLMPRGVFAQDHKGHRPEDMEIHKRFYRNWMQPQNRAVSCCSDEDCEPAEAKMIDGHWWARKVSEADKEFTQIPDARVEHNVEDNPAWDPPDSRAHLCGRRYHFSASDGDKLTVFCFIAGGGT